MGNSKSSSISTLSILGVCFVVLKLTGHITWSWWWVTIPFCGGIAIGIVAMVLLEIFKDNRW